MTAPVITAFYGGLLGLLALILATLVINQRRVSKVGIGDGGDQQMARVARVFGNFAEYTALALVLFAMLEMCGGSRILVHLCAGGFLVGRIGHAIGLSRTPGASPGRAVGVILTFVSIAAASIALLIRVVPAL